MSGAEIEGLDFDQTLSALLKQMESMSAEDLQDSVHRHLDYHLCADCHAAFLSNPLGKPRHADIGRN